MCSRLTSTAPSITAACARLKPAKVECATSCTRAMCSTGRCASSMRSAKPQLDVAQRAGQSNARDLLGRQHRPVAAAGHAAGEDARVGHDVEHGVAGGDDVVVRGRWLERHQHDLVAPVAHAHRRDMRLAVGCDRGHHGFVDHVVHSLPSRVVLRAASVVPGAHQRSGLGRCDRQRSPSPAAGPARSACRACGRSRRAPAPRPCRTHAPHRLRARAAATARTRPGPGAARRGCRHARRCPTPARGSSGRAPARRSRRSLRACRETGAWHAPSSARR